MKTKLYILQRWSHSEQKWINDHISHNWSIVQERLFKNREWIPKEEYKYLRMVEVMVDIPEMRDLPKD